MQSSEETLRRRRFADVADDAAKTQHELVPLMDRVPSPISQVSSLLAFKVANYSKDVLGKYPLLNVYVVVHLAIPLRPGGLCDSDEGHRIQTINEVSSARKYCCPHAIVIGIQFVGKPEEVKRALLYYQQKYGFVTSKFNGAFHYEVETEVNEPLFAQPGRGGCVQGIHFYTDLESATKFGGCADVYDKYPIITRRFDRARQGLIEAVPNTFSKRWFSSQKKSNEPTKWTESSFQTRDWVEVISNHST
jgi:hypothetical protein